MLAAPVTGSFLGVLIRRLPRGERVALDRSRCENCERVLSIRDLVPIASYLALRGRCRSCAARIVPFHISIELVAVAVAAVVASVAPDTPTLWCGCVLGWALLALGSIDARHFILPDALTLPLILLGLGATGWRDPAALSLHAAAAALAYLLFRLIAQVYRHLRGREGLGEGDAKLIAAAGAWVGVSALSDVLLCGALLTLAAALISALWRRERLRATLRLPFGPGLCAALWAVWLLHAAR